MLPKKGQTLCRQNFRRKKRRRLLRKVVRVLPCLKVGLSTLGNILFFWSRPSARCHPTQNAVRSASSGSWFSRTGISERILLVSFGLARNPCSPQIGGSATV